MYLRIANTDLRNAQIKIVEWQKDYSICQEGRISIFVYGYPYIKSKWIKAEDVYNYYIKSSDLEFINNFDGIYSIIILDIENSKCYVITDRYGIYTLFYFKHEKKEIYYISDKIDTLIKFMDKIKINTENVMEYLTFGYCSRIGSKTLIDGIFEFKRASIYEMKKNFYLRKIYWEFPAKKSRYSFLYDLFYEDFNNHILDGYNMWEERKLLTLTGGLDTRTILSTVIGGNNLQCSTYGTKSSGDIKGAQNIAKQFGIKHIPIILDKEYIMSIPEKLINNIDMFNGLLAPAFQLHWLDFCKKNRYQNDMLFLGILGDEIWRCHWGDPDEIYAKKDLDEISIYLMNNNMIKKSKILNVFKDMTETDIRNNITHSIKKELSWYKGEFDPMVMVDYFVLGYYASNWASNLIKFFGQHFKIFLGLISKEILERLIYCNPRTRVTGELQKHILKRNNLELANIPYCHNRFNDGKTFKGKIKKIIYNVKSLTNRFTHRFLNFTLFKYFPDLPHYYYVWLPKYHKKFILDVLNYDTMITKNLFKKEELQKIIKLFLKSDYSVKGFTIALLSLEIYLKKLSKDNKIEVE